MSGVNPVASELELEVIKERLGELLFPVEAARSGGGAVPRTTYAVLDGAAIPDLLDELYANGERPEFACLYRGELEPDIAAVAPYLVRLDPESAFTDWLLTHGWGKHFGIFARSAAGLEMVRRHFRKFLRVKGPEGNILYFRYYDPRVLRVYLPTCVAAETETLFGPVECYMAEVEGTDKAMVFTVKDGEVVCQEHPLHRQTTESS